ncbi:MAG: hypothetical protein KKC77_19385 [Proteobacteria bacterium]|nr:hypothetical protein [Pseudomonadota bacterium]
MDYRLNFYNLVTKIYKDIDYPEIPIPIYAMFYVVLSQYFNNVNVLFGGEKRKLRLSFFIIAPSRTGKGQLYKITKMVAEKLNLRTAVETTITDAGLIGSIDEKAVDYNLKHKLNEGDADYKDPIVKGDLFNFDILFFREVKNLLVARQNTEMLLSILQEALDEPGYVRKKLRSKYPIEGECTASIIATTYYMPEIEKTLLEQGFFMRVPLYCRTFSIEEIRKLRHDIIGLFNKKNLENIDKYVDDFVQEIKKISNVERNITLSVEAINRLEKFNNNFYDLMRKTAGNKLEILKSISQTAIDICVKIGGIHACLDGNKEIKDHHIKLAIVFVKACVGTILNKIEITDNIKTDKYVKIFEKIEKKYGEGKVTKELFKKELCEFYSFGMNKALKVIKSLSTENYIIINRGDKNTQIVTLNKNI